MINEVIKTNNYNLYESYKRNKRLFKELEFKEKGRISSL